ncbi:SH3 domain-containing protein [Clostridium sp. YIM B02505]|uniref:SH3 domain-containing protein n=1 Tax=Clostridium yunnanense TaxID=2800325 RepID=A0ABS1ENF5_9CLOT|nr:SH3 domain-containing protein [Clostridium yunnanense]MBK1810937.1 SH3 domain-containing protein [Clostridium yunnanense]
MNRKKILQLLLATSAIASTIGFTNQYVHATEQTQVQKAQVNSVSYHNIMGSSEASKEQMINYFKSSKISNYQLSVSIDDFVNIAYEEAQAEGVRGDIVVAQAFLETGYFRYNDGKGIVTAEDNNFAGIGAIGTDQSRSKFKDVREGLRAQVQHLKAYASTEPLKNEKVDPRFQLVTRGSAKSLEELGGKWACPGYDTTAYSSFEEALNSGETYGQRIYSIIGRAIGVNNTTKSSGNITEIKQASSEKGQVVNVSTNLRMRQSASTDSPVISYLNNGQTFDIKGVAGDWYYINIDGKLGYIHKDYVKETPTTTVVVLAPASTNSNVSAVTQTSTVQTTTTQAKGQVINVSTSLRMRQLANIGSAVIGYLNNGQTFDIKEKSGDWYYIKLNDKLGYVHKDYVKEISATTETSTPANNNQNTSNNTNQSNTNQQNNQPTSTVEKPSKGQVINISTTLRIRQSANTSSAIIGYLYNGQAIDIKEVSGDWYYIQVANRTGYVNKQYVKVTETSNSTTGQKPTDSQNAPIVQPPTTQVPTTQQPQTPQIPQVTVQTGMVYNVTTNLRLRSKASSDSSVVAYILPNQTFKILGSSGDWFNIDFNGKTGYVSKAYAKVVSETNVPGNVITNNEFQEVYNVLKNQIGTPYIYGGYGQEITSSLIDLLKKAFPSQATRGMYDSVPVQFINKGYKAFDCSGLMQWGFKQAGINIGRTTYDQINNGKEVSKDEVKPGDLLFYSDISHVGMYVGDGKWIEAPNSKSFVRVVEVPWNKIGRVRRIIN